MKPKTNSKKRKWCNRITLIPVFIAVICIFSTGVCAQNNVNTLNGGVENTITDNDRMITRGKGVSEELLTEYQEIVNKYLEKRSTGNPDENDKFYWKSDYLLAEDWARLYVIFVQMTYIQQCEQMISFNGPPPAIVDWVFSPPQYMYDLWIEDTKAKILIDGERVDNSVLKSRSPDNFVGYFTSSLHRSGGQRDEYRVDLWTATGHKKFSEEFYKQPVTIAKLLEIEPRVIFLVEKDNYKPVTLQLYVGMGPRSGWSMTKVTDLNEDNLPAAIISSPSTSTPSTYHQKTAAELYISDPQPLNTITERSMEVKYFAELYIRDPQPLNKWKTGDSFVNSSTFELHAGQTAIYDGEIKGGKFKNFGFKAHVTHSEGAKASLWIHSDANLTKGYSILIGKPAGDRRRSGSLASVRNLYKPRSSSFDIDIVVQGKRIVVMIDGMKVVDYLEPYAPYRTAANAAQLLTDGGLIGFRAENGTLTVANADITPLADNLSNYPEGKTPIDEQNDVLIRLQQRNFPVIDYHVHWPRMLGLEAAMERSLADGFEYGIAANCGIGFQTTNDEQIRALFKNNFTLPPLFYAMQGEGREWVEVFSKESREMFDYVFTDALTFNDHKGRRTHLWIDSEVIIDIPEQEYMDMIMDRTLKIINGEPIDFLASPTRLCAVMMKDYDEYWTDARVAQLIKALKDNDIALEINAVTKVPSAKIIKAAKAAGLKFTLGTNNAGIQELDRLDYSLRMVEECGLTIDDMWFPKN